MFSSSGHKSPIASNSAMVSGLTPCSSISFLSLSRALSCSGDGFSDVFSNGRSVVELCLAIFEPHLALFIADRFQRSLSRLDERSRVLNRRHRKNTMTEIQDMTPPAARANELARFLAYDLRR